MAGKRSGSFPVEGILETAKLINSGGEKLAESVVMESGHCKFRFCAAVTMTYISRDVLRGTRSMGKAYPYTLRYCV
jgi:hypothetical protein